MKKLADSPPDSSPVDPFAIVLATILKHPLVQEALRAATVANVTPPEQASVGGLVSLQAAAKYFGVSVATICRWLLEGGPFEQVGTRRKIDLAIFREWVRARGPKASKARPEGSPDPIDVSSIAARAGLRIAGRG